MTGSVIGKSTGWGVGGGEPCTSPSPNQDRVKDIHGISEADKCTKCLHPAEERSLAAADICPFNV